VSPEVFVALLPQLRQLAAEYLFRLGLVHGRTVGERGTLAVGRRRATVRHSASDQTSQMQESAAPALL
jgi:hypothetical protein